MARDIYLALGDSITAGHVGLPGGSTYPFPLFSRLRQLGAAQRFLMIAQNGWTSRQLLGALAATPPGLFREVSIATLCIGGNDLRHLLRRQALSLKGRRPPSLAEISVTVMEASERLNVIAGLISRHRIPHVIMGTLYNPSPNSELAVEAISMLNAAIRDVAKRHGFDIAELASVISGDEATCIDGYKTGELRDLMTIVRRPIHPNANGHRRIARLFQQVFSKAHKGQNRVQREAFEKRTTTRRPYRKRSRSHAAHAARAPQSPQTSMRSSKPHTHPSQPRTAQVRQSQPRTRSSGPRATSVRPSQPRTLPARAKETAERKSVRSMS